MKTEVIMQRPFLNSEVGQLSHSSYLCATDITKIYNEIRVTQGKAPKEIKDYFVNKGNQEFMVALCNELNLLVKKDKGNSPFNPTKPLFYQPKMLKQNKRGKDNKGVWMHPYLFADYAQQLSPEFRAKVAIWIGDNLLLFRNVSGDSFNECNLALDKKFEIGNNYRQYVKIARFVAKQIMGTEVADQWNTATVMQLKQRDDLLKKIAIASEFGTFNNIDDLLSRVGGV